MRYVFKIHFLLTLPIVLACLAPARPIKADDSVNYKDLSSKENEIYDFFAFGVDSSGNSIVASKDGGFVTFRGKLIMVMPWHVFNWPSQNLWIVSLVNVSQHDFYIIYLYLDGSFDGTPKDGFWIFEYAIGTIQWVGPLVGTQRLNRTVVKTPSTTMPKIEIQPYPKVWNSLRVSSPSFSLDAQRGFLNWGSMNLTVYPILNLFNVTDRDDTWHELWILLKDPVGKNYYFAIIYMFTDDKDHVKMGYMLRLDDYMVFVPPANIINAHWSYVAEFRQGTTANASGEIATKFDAELFLFLEILAILFIIIAALVIATYFYSRLE
jgi:hypothetical protein